MGISYIAVACSLDSLASIFSSRDEGLFERVAASDDRKVRHYLDTACRKGRCSPEEVLAELFRGAALSRFRPHVYAYALVACAYALGDDLGGFDCSYSRPDKLNTRLEELGESAEVVPWFIDPWPLPGVTPDDGPACATLRADAVAPRAASTRLTLDRVAASLTGDDDDISLGLLIFFTEAYEAAARRGLDLFLVAH